MREARNLALRMHVRYVDAERGDVVARLFVGASLTAVGIRVGPATRTVQLFFFREHHADREAGDGDTENTHRDEKEAHAITVGTVDSSCKTLCVQSTPFLGDVHRR